MRVGFADEKRSFVDGEGEIKSTGGLVGELNYLKSLVINSLELV
jgi:hypothetical protein